MVVQHNLQAMNANRMLNITTGAQSKSTEKLSSGYRINRAADDAAGLSISEKMRKQIRGLDRASTNAQDGVSAVQTAEGALTEVHSMLQRMNELAVQASNGTNSKTDRQSIQDEIDQLTTEIDRVAETTKFNEIYLLKGDAQGKTKTNTVAAHDAGLAGKLVDNEDGTSTFTVDKALAEGSKVTIAGKEYTIGKTPTDADYVKKATADTYTPKANLSAGDTITKEDGTVKTIVDKVAVANKPTLAANDVYTDDHGKEWTVVADADTPTGNQITVTDANAALTTGCTVTKLGGATANLEIVAALGTDEISSQSTNALTFDAGDKITHNGSTITVTNEEPDSFEDIKKAINELAKDDSVDINGTTYKVAAETKIDKQTPNNSVYSRDDIIAMIKEGDTVDVNGAGDKTVYGVDSTTDTADKDVITATKAYRMMAEELTNASSIGTDDGKGAVVTDKGNGVFEIKQGTVEVKDALSFSLHVGADADMTNKINVDIDTMSAAGLGIKGLNVKDDSGIAATYAIDAIADAVAKVSAQRSALGAVQNRLEHTIDNVDNVVENTTAAESRIRDTDMAEEMVEYSKNNILAQAGQSMLAQANQANQGVLSLLG